MDGLQQPAANRGAKDARSEEDEATDLRWKTYHSLEPQLAHLPPELLKIREANFRRMKPAAQRSLITPLLENAGRYKKVA